MQDICLEVDKTKSARYKFLLIDIVVLLRRNKLSFK